MVATKPLLGRWCPMISAICNFSSSSSPPKSAAPKSSEFQQPGQAESRSGPEFFGVRCVRTDLRPSVRRPGVRPSRAPPWKLGRTLNLEVRRACGALRRRNGGRFSPERAFGILEPGSRSAKSRCSPLAEPLIGTGAVFGQICKN